MKKKVKLKLQFYLFLLMIPLLFLSCNDDFETDGIHFGIKNKNINVKLLKGVNALNVYNKLVLESKKNTSFDISQGKLRVTKGNRYSRNTQDLIIDYSQVLQVIDTLGKSNYTFRIINHPEDDEDTFHNLVYNFESEESAKINLLKYNGITPSFNTTGNASVTSVSLTDDIDCNPSEIPLPIWNPTPGGSDSPVGSPGGTVENPDNGAIPNPGSSGYYGGYGSFTGGVSGNGGNSLSDSYYYFICNNCSVSFHSLESASTHNTLGEGFTFVIKFGKTQNQTNYQPTITNDPCNPSNDVGVLPPSEKTPCEELNKFNDNNAIQQSLQILKTQSSGVAERGNYISEITNSVGATYLSFPIIPQDPKNPNLLYIAGGLSTGKVKGAMHCHTNPTTTGMFPMFSAADLEALYQIAYSHVPMNNAEKDYAEYTVMLSVGSGHYALKLKNFSGNYAKFNANIIDFQKELEDNNKKLTASAASSELIKVFKKNLNKYFGDEVGLYKATETIDANGLPKVSGWKEQTLNENGDIIEINCQ